MMHIYYGNGKGKTTCAIGLGMRAYGAGKKVSMVQFLKSNKSSELCALPFDIFPSPDSLPFNPDESYQKWVDTAVSFINEKSYDVIILDEFLDVYDSFIAFDASQRLIGNLRDREVILTGHRKIDALFEKADYITEMVKIKHPYDNGIKARKGIEF